MPPRRHTPTRSLLRDTGPTGAAAPDPGPVGSIDEFIGALRELRSWAGDPSVTTLTREVRTIYGAAGRPMSEWPARTTVWACFRAGRVRPDRQLLLSLVRVFVRGDEAVVERWRRALHSAISTAGAARQVAVHTVLPAVPPDFVGRAASIGRIAAGPPVQVWHGPAGIGKTSLVARAGHRLGAAGGVLFVDLRGFDADLPPADPAAVLQSFLRLRGVPGHAMPTSPAERSMLYRRRLAGTGTLVVLDNAADEDQVRPLLPDDGRVLITSRRRLDGLVEASHHETGPLSAWDAESLVRAAAGPHRVAAHPRLPRALVDQLGGLPLAVAVVARHLRDHPDWTLADYPAVLPDLVLEAGVGDALALSVGALPADAARLFRRLALHAGPDFGLGVAAALAGAPPTVARGSLDSLVAASLVRAVDGDRYALVGPIRLYAAARLRVDEPRSGTDAAARRLLRFYQNVTTEPERRSRASC